MHDFARCVCNNRQSLIEVSDTLHEHMNNFKVKLTLSASFPENLLCTKERGGANRGVPVQDRMLFIHANKPFGLML